MNFRASCKIHHPKPLSTDYADSTDVKKCRFAANSAPLRNQSLNNQCNLRNLRLDVSRVLQEALKHVGHLCLHPCVKLFRCGVSHASNLDVSTALTRMNRARFCDGSEPH